MRATIPLSKFRDACECDSWGWERFFDTPESASAYSNADKIAFAILGEDYDGDRSAANDFWETHAGLSGSRRRQEGGLADKFFVCGFADGAVDVWSEVEGQL